MEERPQFLVGYEKPSETVGVVVLEGEIDIYSAPQFKEVLVNGIEDGAQQGRRRPLRGHLHRLHRAGSAGQRRQAGTAPQRQPRHRLHRREHHPHLRDHRPRPHLRHLRRPGTRPSRRPAADDRRRRRAAALSRRRPTGGESMELRSTKALQGPQSPQRGRRHAQDEDIRGGPHLRGGGLRHEAVGLQPERHVRSPRRLVAGRLPSRARARRASARRSRGAAPSSPAAASSPPRIPPRSTAATPAA